MKNYLDSIGLDVSKNYFDAVKYHSSEHSQFSNDPKGLKAFHKWICGHKSNPEDFLVCFEHTGYYSLQISVFLKEHGYDYVQEHALQIKRSIGFRKGKSDKTDATDIARYGWLNRERLKLSSPPMVQLLKLQQLKTARDLLIRQIVALKNHLKGLKVLDKGTLSAIAYKTIEKALKTLEKQVQALEEEMINEIRKDKNLDRTFELCCSVKGVGLVMAVELIVHTQNFSCFENWRKFASYCGTVPYPFQSGSSVHGRSRIHPVSDGRMKSLLTMSTISALRVDPELKRYYTRRVEEGKPKMSVINMVRNKMLARVFATVKRGTPFITMSKFAA